jgi:hypothetical protein
MPEPRRQTLSGNRDVYLACLFSALTFVDFGDFFADFGI